MSKCPFPEHHSTGGGSGIVAVVVVLLAAIVAVRVAGPVVHAAAALAEILAVAAAVAVVLAAVAGAALLAHRARRGVPRAVPVHRVRVLPRQAAQPLPDPRRPAIEAPQQDLHLHFHGLSAEDVAAIIKQNGE